MKETYFKSVVMIERLHRLFLEVMKFELDRMNIYDINNVQCLILYKVGREEVTVGDFRNHGYYLGSNVNYNLRMMVQHEYVTQKPNDHDRRSSCLKLSEKGLALYDKLDKLFETHVKALALGDIKAAQFKELNDTLITLETFWKGMLTRWNDKH